MVKVKIYSTTTCPYCKMEKEYLDSKGIKYENVFVDNDTKAAEEMISESGQMSVPFTEVPKDDGSISKIIGLDNEKIKEIVDNHFNQVSSLVNSYKDKLEDLFKIMHLHIDELGGLSKDVEKQEERIKKIEEKFK